MRIGINIDQLLYRISGGTGRYSHKLIDSLSRIDEHNEYLLFHSNVAKENLDKIRSLNLNTNFSVKRLPFSRPLLYYFWNRVRVFSAERFLGRLDLIHAPTFAIPPKGSAKLIVTVHDLAFLKFPEFYTPRSLKFHQRSAKIAAHEADLLIAVSDNTKHDIISLLSVDEDRVRVIYEGVDIDRSLSEKDKESGKRVLSSYGINKKFLLFVGTLEPRKNVVRLIQAFSRFKQETAFEHSLVIAGPRGWLDQQIIQEAGCQELDGDILLTGPVTDTELAIFMSHADLFVYPSLYEGFGLPPLEAMAWGVPVITSNVSSLPEVVGDAAIVVDPYEIDEIATAIINLLGDSALRIRLVQKGKERVKLFSWEKMAKATLEAYQIVAGGVSDFLFDTVDSERST